MPDKVEEVKANKRSDIGRKRERERQRQRGKNLNEKDICASSS